MRGDKNAHTQSQHSFLAEVLDMFKSRELAFSIIGYRFIDHLLVGPIWA